MLNLASITSAATLKLVIYKLLELDEGMSDSDLCVELGISNPSLWRAKQAVATLDLIPRRLDAPVEPAIEEEEDDSLEREAEVIDAIQPDGRVGLHRSGADVRRRKLRLFIPKVWREKVPTGEKLSVAQIDDLAKVAEQNTAMQMGPAALILDRINTFALLHADRVTTTQYRYLRKMILNAGIDDRKPVWKAKPQWTPKPGEAATEEEARAARMDAARAEVDKIKAMTRGAGPRRIGMLDEED